MSFSSLSDLLFFGGGAKTGQI